MAIRIAGTQMPVGLDISVNVENLRAAIDFAADMGAEILLTPEGSLSGYTHEFDVDLVKEGLREVTAWACDRKVGLALGTCFVEDDGRCYNQIRFYKSDGKYLGFHAKILRCGTMTNPPIGEINHFQTTPLRIFRWEHDLTFGGLICNDMWANPECTPLPDTHLSQSLAEMGVHIIFHAVNGGRNGSEWSQVAWHYHESNLRMRARAGKVWIVTVDNCSPMTIPCSAPSGVISPRGDWMCQVDPIGTQYFVYTIDV